MSRTINVTIAPEMNDFAEKLVESGRYDSVSEVVCFALLLLERRESQLMPLKRAIEDGENSGESEFNLKDIIKRILNVNIGHE